MLVVYKYPLRLEHVQVLSLPLGAVCLDVQTQGDNLCLWAIVETDMPRSDRAFRIYGTGQAIEIPYSHLQYIATAKHGEYGYVWHVFEEKKL